MRRRSRVRDGAGVLLALVMALFGGAVSDLGPPAREDRRPWPAGEVPSVAATAPDAAARLTGPAAAKSRAPRRASDSAAAEPPGPAREPAEPPV
ncbi:hypothetical protein, partial [Amycolatopsis sp. NPDC004378]